MLNQINNDQYISNQNQDQNTTFLNNCKLNLIAPNTSGVLRKSESINKLNGYQGGKLLKSMTESQINMPDKDYPEHIDLSNNHLKQNDILPFICTLRSKLLHLNIQNNRLNPKGCILMAEYLSDYPLLNLTQLNVEAVNMGDKAGAKFIDSLNAFQALNHLNLNKNELGTLTAAKLSNIIQDHGKIPLNHLELHQNNFKGEDMMGFFSYLNISAIKVLDISWNKLGSSVDCMKLLADKLAENKLLYQLDISHNDIKLNSEHFEYFTSCLDKNHSITGLHITGNDMRIDIDGRVLSQLGVKSAYVLTKVQSEGSILSKGVISTQNKNLLTQNWISEKWLPIDVVCNGQIYDQKYQEKKLKQENDVIKENQGLKRNSFMDAQKVGITKIKSDTSAEDFIKQGKIKLNFRKITLDDPLFVFFEFDDQQPWYIEKSDVGTFVAQFMVPPGRWKFFFTSQLAQFMLSQEQKIDNMSEPITKTIIQDPKEPLRSKFDITIYCFNSIYVPPNMQQIDQSDSPVKPRSRPKWCQSDSAVIWSFPISIWAQEKWRTDDFDMYAKCFDHDWELVKDKLPKAIISNEVEKAKIKIIVREHQYLLLYVYKHFSSQNMLGDVSCITENEFIFLFEKLDQFNEYQTKELPAIVFRETITSDRNNFATLAPSAGCVRHQFMNFMIKSAVRKFKLEPKSDITYSAAVEQLFTAHGGAMAEYNPNTWRWANYYNEKVDLYIKKVRVVLDEIYTRQVNKYGMKAGSKPSQGFDAFKMMINDLQLTEQSDDIEYGRYYFMGTQLHVSHVSSDAFMKMRTKFEFQEALGRLVDECYIQYNEKGVKYPETEFKDLELGDKLWVITPLFLKLFDKEIKKDLKFIELIKKLCNESQVISVKIK